MLPAPTEQFHKIAKKVTEVLIQYRLSGRQLDTLLRLLTASWNLEEAQLHQYSAIDIGRLAASTIPLQLTKNKWSIDSETLAMNVAKMLPDFPWTEQISSKVQVASVRVEENQLKYSSWEISALAKEALKADLDGFVAFEVMLKKIKDDPKFKVPFDNFSTLLKV